MTDNRHIDVGDDDPLLEEIAADYGGWELVMSDLTREEIEGIRDRTMLHGEREYQKLYDMALRTLEAEERNRQLEAALQQERDIRNDRETILKLIGEYIGLESEPHQTYWERMLERIETLATSPPDSEPAEDECPCGRPNEECDGLCADSKSAEPEQGEHDQCWECGKLNPAGLTGCGIDSPTCPTFGTTPRHRFVEWKRGICERCDREEEHPIHRSDSEPAPTPDGGEGALEVEDWIVELAKYSRWSAIHSTDEVAKAVHGDYADKLEAMLAAAPQPDTEEER